MEIIAFITLWFLFTFMSNDTELRKRQEKDSDVNCKEKYFLHYSIAYVTHLFTHY